VKKAAILLLLGVLATYICPMPAEARPVRMFELRRSDERQVRVLPGVVRAAEHAELAFRVGGTLQEISVVRGSRVIAGDLIATLDRRDFEVALQGAQSELERAEAQLSAMRSGARQEEIAALTAQVSAARSQYNEAQLNLERHRALLEAGGISQSQFDRVMTAYDVARGSLNVAEQNLRSGRAGARPEEIEMQEALIRGLTTQVIMAQDALNDTELRAPFSGVVAEIYVENFQSVQRNQSIVMMQDLLDLEVVASIPGRIALQVSPERARDIRARVRAHDISLPDERNYAALGRFPSLPDRLFDLHIRELSTQANVQTQAYDAIFMMERPDDLIVLPGMGIDVLLSLDGGERMENGFAIPFSALAAGTEGAHVWKVEELDGAMTVRRVDVTVVGYIGDNSIVTGDLTEGDLIVSAGLSHLRDGDRVTRYISPADRASAIQQ